MTDSTISSAPAAGAETAPAGLKDKYGVPYSLTGQAPNGVMTLQRLIPPMLNETFTLVPAPDYSSAQRTALEDLFELTRSDGSPLAEVILPVSTVSEPVQGVVILASVAQMIRGTAWKPDWAHSGAPWNALARLADALSELHQQQIHPARLTRDMLFLSPDGAEIRLLLSDANQLEPAMLTDAQLSPMLPPELLQPGALSIGPAQNAYMLGALILSLLRDWSPSGDGQPMPHAGLISALPDAMPDASLLRETLTRAFSADPASRPDMKVWQDLLRQCAADASNPSRQAPAIPAPASPVPAGGVFTPNGRAWQIPGGESAITPAFCMGSAFRLPVAQWKPWHPVFSTIPLDLARKFRHLRFPDDFIMQGASPVLLYATPLKARDAGWSGILPPPDSKQPRIQHILDGLRILRQLLDEIDLAEKHGIFLTAPDARQFVSGGAWLFLVCGRNAADAANPRMGSQIMQTLLPGYDRASWLPHEMRLALRQGSATTAAWRQMLDHILTNLINCPGCRRQHLHNASCPFCELPSVTLQIRRNQGVREEQRELSLWETEPVRLAALFPGAPATDEMFVTLDTTSDRIIITNVSTRTWRYRSSDNVTRELRHGEMLPLSPGLRIALLPGKLELCCNWPR